MRYEEEGRAELAVQPLELDLHALAQLEIERAERLVKEQHVRLVDDRASERDPLLLPPGEFARIARAEAFEADHREGFRAKTRALGGGHALTPRPELHVLDDRHMRKKRILLEDGVDRPAVGRHALHQASIDADLARGGLHEARGAA